MKFGDTIRIEMKGLDGRSLFGAIDQEVVQLGAKPKASSSAPGEEAPGGNAQED